MLRFIKELHDICVGFFKILFLGYIKLAICMILPKLRGKKISAYGCFDGSNYEYSNIIDAKYIIRRNKDDLTLFPFILLTYYLIFKFSLFGLIQYLVKL